MDKNVNDIKNAIYRQKIYISNGLFGDLILKENTGNLLIRLSGGNNLMRLDLNGDTIWTKTLSETT